MGRALCSLRLGDVTGAAWPHRVERSRGCVLQRHVDLAWYIPVYDKLKQRTKVYWNYSSVCATGEDEISVCTWSPIHRYLLAWGRLHRSTGAHLSHSPGESLSCSYVLTLRTERSLGGLSSAEVGQKQVFPPWVIANLQCLNLTTSGWAPVVKWGT